MSGRLDNTKERITITPSMSMILMVALASAVIGLLPASVSSFVASRNRGCVAAQLGTSSDLLKLDRGVLCSH